MCKTYLYLPFISSPVMGHMYGEMSKSLPALLASVVNAGLAVSLSSLTSYNTISIVYWHFWAKSVHNTNSIDIQLTTLFKATSQCNEWYYNKCEVFTSS